jgi:hypothetical protein
VFWGKRWLFVQCFGVRGGCLFSVLRLEVVVCSVFWGKRWLFVQCFEVRGGCLLSVLR